MDELTSAQRGALDAIKASRGPCPSAETLIEYQGLGDDDRARHGAHEHILICSRCQLVLLGLNEPSRAWLAEARQRVGGLMLPLAAILVLGVAFTILARRGGSLDPPAETVRGTEIQSIAPIGSVDKVTQFSWQSPLAATRYRVTVRRGSDQIWQGETTGLQIDAPSAAFESGVEYQWIVEAIDREGDVRMTSPPQTFTSIRRR